ncbi:DUF2007 domain-containing protein [Pontibacter silvestris]|uniref:DUF2007 domain-containing protein n=1 Tax=Pontibacter silvestris TaxID=2305183 RepID=A0ABW4WRG5_9BACT|nr:DUF2007 domain-containing protein [Pontibacter silvestris]MCC9138190.1 DUF2007 domain-containing protein [Pontibacter silvestris]
MAERLITIATFNELTEAHIIKGRLEAEGILCFLGDEHIVGVQPFYSVAVGGVKLKVPEQDVEEARAILTHIKESNNLFVVEDSEEEETQEESVQAKKCLNCGSDNISEGKHSNSLFSFLPFANSKNKYKCFNCGFQWKQE